MIRHLPRHDEAVLRRCEAAGVATLHEAWDRQGLMGPAIRPIQQGVSRAGNAVTVLVTPGDNWVFHVAVEQCRAGDILVVAPTSPCGVASSAIYWRRLSNRAAWSGWWAISAFVIRKRCGKWDSPSGPVRFMPRDGEREPRFG